MISEKLEKLVSMIIIHHRQVFQESPSPMKLQKLCYYAQAIYMATYNGNTLFEEDFEAWIFGPVIRSLYDEYKEYTWRSIDKEFETPDLDRETQEFIEEIVEAYGRYDGAALSTMTHREEPWLEARKGLSELEGSQNLIQKNTMKRFFENQITTYSL